MYYLFTVKRYLEQFLMFPFVLAGKVYASINPLATVYDYFFFYPSYSIGGGERVQGEILQALPDAKILVIFTKISANAGSLHLHQAKNITHLDIGQKIDGWKKYASNFFYRGVISRYINCQKKSPIVFIAQSNFGYKTLPHIHRRIYITELIHMHSPGFLWVWAPFISFINKRVILGPSILKTFTAVYTKNNIPLHYLNRVIIIPNCLDEIPIHFTEKNNEQLQVYYAGRGTSQKRIWLIIKIIEECRKLNLPIQFTLAGSFAAELPPHLLNDGTYIGEVKAGKNMQTLHQKMDVLLMTSAFEGFPMVIMEAMSFGVVCNVCAVDEIPNYIFHQKTGLLIEEINNEEIIIEQAMENLKLLLNNKPLKNKMAKEAYLLAIQKFTRLEFQKAYQQLLATS
jgi:L-malate glycosyltransferase